MGTIERAAGATVASLIRGELVTLPKAVQQAVAEWALAVTILRAESVPGDHRFDRASARTFRERGLEGADVSVWLVHVEISSEVRGGVNGKMASTYAPGPTGEVALFWLRNLCILVASRGFNTHTNERIAGIRHAAIQIWPPSEQASWPLAHSVTERDLLRHIGIDKGMPATFFKQDRQSRGKLTEVVLRVNNDHALGDVDRAVFAHKVATIVQQLEAK